MSAPSTTATVLDQPVVAVIRHHDLDVAIDLAEGCADGGLRAIEITLTTPGALALIEALAVTIGPDVHLGAGTVLDAAAARRVVDAGATFLVSPVTDPDVVDVGTAAGVPVIPGAFTPTEIARAARLGAPMVKVFPAGCLGTGFVRGVTSVLPDVPLLVSGGIAGPEVGAWREAGARTVAIGGDLNKAHDEGGRAAVQALARRLADAHPPQTTSARINP